MNNSKMLDNSRMLNDMQQLQKKIFDRLSSKQSLVRTLIYLIIAIIVVLLTSYILNKIALNDESCNKMKKTLTSDDYEPGDLGSGFNETYTLEEAKKIGNSAQDDCDTETTCHWYGKPVMLRNYNIKSSYNSCCANLYKNGWVSQCALREVIAQGCRFLDFEVYSYKGKPVVGVSTKVNDYYMKECYNYIPIGIVFDIIYNRAFTENDCARTHEQPLIINLRFKTNNKDVLDDVGKSLKNSLNGKLLNSCDSIYNYRSTVITDPNNVGYNNFGTIGMDRIKGKVILFTDLTDDILLQTNKLRNSINMSSKSNSRPHLKVYRYTEIIGKTQAETDWQNNMIICLPDLSNMCQPMDYNKVNGVSGTKGDWDNDPATSHTHVDLGIQIFANCFQSESDELKAYIKHFNDKQSAFVKQTQ